MYYKYLNVTIKKVHNNISINGVIVMSLLIPKSQFKGFIWLRAKNVQILVLVQW